MCRVYLWEEVQMARSAIDIARETVECFNAGDWERLRDLHAPDCVEEEFATERSLHSFDEMLEAAKGWKRAFPDAHGTVIDAYGDGPIAVLEIEWEGANSGPMQLPHGGEMPATGRGGHVKACQVFEIHDGRVTATRHYFNLMTLLNQLGVGSRAAAGVS
jgi:steroid delta-isomerase-like uncharacterized protein